MKYEDVFTVNARKNIDNLVIDRHSKKIYTGWTAWNRKDKYVYTRMYQKQVEALDICKKIGLCTESQRSRVRHGELYMDYLDYPWKVWRLEFEFGSKFTTSRKKISFFDEFYNHELTKQIFEYIWLSPKIWYFSKPKNKLNIPFSKLDPYRQKRIITQTLNNISKIHQAWYNPFALCIESIRSTDPMYLDDQVMHTYFEIALYDNELFPSIMNHIEKIKISTKELYDKIYKAQLWVDI